MIKVITAPPYYPVSRAEAKNWLYAEQSFVAQDAVIDMLIAAMTDYAEHKTGRAFIQRTLELNLARFAYCISLPWPPLIGVDSISYTDSDEAAATVAGADYEVDTVSEPGRVRTISTASWPSIGTRFNPVRIQYRCGYAPVGSPQDETAHQAGVPDVVKTWIHARLATLYENREQLIQSNQVKIPNDFCDGLLDSLVIGTRLF